LFTSNTEGSIEADLEGNTEVVVMLDDEETTFTMKKSESILDAVLNQDLDPPYSCQGGICSSCIARLTEGKAEMRKNQILTDDEVAEGLILTCQAHPTTSKVVVDFDEV
jgi:ring-1,2-phenylacetyl-CoA epoxidase subunit PaaE